MGYGVGLLYYPPTHDRRTIIPEATALALITDGTVPGRLYWTVAEAPAGRLVYHPGNATSSVTPPEGADLTSGWYSGEAVWHNATSSGHVSDLCYYPANQTFVTGATPADAHTIVVEDAVWNQPVIVKAAWTVDTAEKGVPRSAYDGQDPFFNGGDGLWLGRPLSRDDRLDVDITIAGRQPLDEAPPFLANESLTAALRIPVSEPSPPLMTWLESVANYYTSTWYPAGVSWSYNDRWRLHENILEMHDPLLENPGPTRSRVSPRSSPRSLADHVTIQEMDSDNSKEMTPATPGSRSTVSKMMLQSLSGSSAGRRSTARSRARVRPPSAPETTRWRSLSGTARWMWSSSITANRLEMTITGGYND